MIPCRAWIDGYDQLWALLGVQGEVRRLTKLAEATRETCPPLVSWLTRDPMKALRLKARWIQRYRFRRKPG